MIDDLSLVLRVLLDPPSRLVGPIWMTLVGGPILAVIAGEILLRMEDMRIKFILFCLIVGSLGYGTHLGLEALAHRALPVETVITVTTGLLVLVAIFDWFALFVVPELWHGLIDRLPEHEAHKAHVRLLATLGGSEKRSLRATENTARKIRFRLARFTHAHACDVVIHSPGEIWVQTPKGDPLAAVNITGKRQPRYTLRDVHGHILVDGQPLRKVTERILDLIGTELGQRSG